MTGSPQVTSGGPPYASTFGQSGGLLGFRYFEFMPLAIYRLNNLSQTEEVSILGPGSSFFGNFYAVAKAQINFAIGTVTSGDTIVAQINGTPATYTVQNTDTLASISSGLSAAINANSYLTAVVSANVPSTGVVGVTAKAPGFLANSLTVQVYTTGTTFTSESVSVYGSPATPTITLQGGIDPPGPVWVDTSQTVVMPYFGYLPIIRYWESQITNASSGQDTIKADVFTQRQDELAARMGGYYTWCKRLCQWMMIPYRGAGSFDGNQPIRRIS